MTNTAPKCASDRRYLPEGSALKHLTVWLVVLCLVGCTTLTPIRASPSGDSQANGYRNWINPGDRVVVRTRDGTTHKFTVTAVSADTIQGEHDAVAVDQITAIDRSSTDRGKTVNLVLVTLLGVAIAATAIGLRHGVGLAGH